MLYYYLTITYIQKNGQKYNIQHIFRVFNSVELRTVVSVIMSKALSISYCETPLFHVFDVECGAGLVPFVCMFEYALHISVQYKKQHHGLPQDFYGTLCGCVWMRVCVCLYKDSTTYLVGASR